MKILLFLIFIPVIAFSQVTLDSSEVSKLIIKLHKLDYLEQNDSLNNVELIKKDSVIFTYQAELVNESRINTNLETDNQWLRQQLAEIKSSALKWYHYAGGSTLILIIGILTGLLIK